MSGGQHGAMKQVWLRCPVCDDLTMIWRRQSKLKERDHVKHLYCPVCMMVTPHVEMRDR